MTRHFKIVENGGIWKVFEQDTLGLFSDTGFQFSTKQAAEAWVGRKGCFLA